MHVDDVEVLALLLDEELLVELLDEVDLLGADQQVVELLEHRPIVNGEDAQRHIAGRVPLVDEQQDARRDLDLGHAIVGHREEQLVIGHLPHTVRLALR